jgi:hypothetical protein
MAKNKPEPFRFHSGEEASTVTDLQKLCKKYPQEAQYHLNEGHFADWLNYINKPDSLPKVSQIVQKAA